MGFDVVDQTVFVELTELIKHLSWLSQTMQLLVHTTRQPTHFLGALVFA